MTATDNDNGTQRTQRTTESTEKRKEKALIEAAREKLDSTAINDLFLESRSFDSSSFSVSSVLSSVSSVSRSLLFVPRWSHR
jgi:hypothetical protein